MRRRIREKISEIGWERGGVGVGEGFFVELGEVVACFGHFRLDDGDFFFQLAEPFRFFFHEEFSELMLFPSELPRICEKTKEKKSGMIKK